MAAKSAVRSKRKLSQLEDRLGDVVQTRHVGAEVGLLKVLRQRIGGVLLAGDVNDVAEPVLHELLKEANAPWALGVQYVAIFPGPLPLKRLAVRGRWDRDARPKGR